MPDAPLRPLVPAEEEWLAAEVRGGRRPTVHVLNTSGGLDAGTRGKLVSADAPHEGEYLLVDVRNDRLPFAATELALPPTVAKRVRKAAGVVDPPPRPRRAASAARGNPTAGSAGKRATAPKPTGSAPARQATAKAATAKPTANPASAKPATAKQTARPNARRKPVPITVTLHFDGVARWTVEARSGTRRVRPAEVAAGAAAAAAEALGVPEIDALVGAVTDAMRREAEDRAAALRAQLAAAEAELARLTR